MRLTDALSVYKLLCETEILDEAMTSEFTIGFELEGVCTKGEKRSYDLPGYHSNNQPSGDVKVLFNKLNEKLGFGEGKIESDSSLSPSRDKGGWTFEYASPKIPFNPQNAEKIYTFLKGLPELGVYTNDSCGFHTHISYPDIDKVNACWILCCISLDKGMEKEMTKLTTESGEDIDFFGHYASEDRIRDIREAIYNEDWGDLKGYLNTDKYQNTRIHPQGTIEWRGPRNFMNKGNVEDIHRFILKLYRVVSKFAKYSRMNEIPSNDGKTFKKEFMAKHCMSSRGIDFNSPVEKKKVAREENLFKALKSGKKSFFSLPENDRLSIISDHNYRNDDILNGLFRNKNDMEKILTMPADKAMMYIKPMIQAVATGYDYESQLNNFVYALMRQHGMDISKKLDKEDYKLIQEKLLSIAISSSDYRTDEIYEKLNEIYKPLVWEGFGPIVKKNAMKDFNYARKLPYFYNRFKGQFSPENEEALWEVFLNPKRLSLLNVIDEIPVKYQRKLVRKNPFNIQYIKNPDKAIVDWVLKKEPEAKDYMLGGL